MANGMEVMNYQERTDAPLFTINGEQMPFIVPTDYVIVDGVRRPCTANPARDYNELSEQLVRSTRNANGEVIAKVINRRLNKFDSLRWPYLSAEQVKWLKNQIAKFECNLGYWDSEEGKWVVRKYYWGDFSATPCEWEVVRGGDPFSDPNGRAPAYFKRPSKYKDVKVNLIDMGIGGKKPSNWSSTNA